MADYFAQLPVHDRRNGRADAEQDGKTRVGLISIWHARRNRGDQLERRLPTDLPEKTGVSLPRFVWMQAALPLEQNQQRSLHKEYP